MAAVRRMSAGSEQWNRLLREEADRRAFLRKAAFAGTGALLSSTWVGHAKERGDEIPELQLAVDWEGGGPPLDLTRGPATAYQFYSLSVALEGLLHLDEHARLQPRLAESWSNPDPRTYVFKLRRGVTFWDGSPLTAQDVVYAFTRHADRQWASNFAWFFPQQYESIEIPAADEVVFRLKEPNVYFAAAAGMTASYVVKASFAEAHRRDLGTASVLTMGTGPYRITRYAANDRIELVRNERYWGEKPLLRRIVLRAVEDGNSQLLALRAGEIDGSMSVPKAAVPRWKRTPGIGVVTFPSARCWWSAFDREVKPLDDIHVRRALAHALDREGLKHVLFRGRARLAQAFAPPETWSQLLPPQEIEALYAELPHNPYDLDRAREELAQSSVPGGFELTVPVEALPDSEKIMQVWQAGLARIGVRLHLESVSRDEYRSRFFRRTRPVGIFITEWGTEFPDPLWNAVSTVRSEQAVAGAWNLSNLKRPAIASLLARCQSTPDPALRGPLARELTRRLAEDCGFYPLFWPDESIAFDRRKVEVDDFKWWAVFSPIWTSFLRPPA